MVAAISLLSACSGTTQPASDGTSSATGTAPNKHAKISIAMPGPHDYFSPWAQSAADAAKKWGFEATYDLPPSDQFTLTQQNQLIDSLVTKGYNGFGLFPGDPQGTVAEEQKLADQGIPTVNINGCTNDPGPAVMCISTDVYAAAKYQAEQLVKAIGAKGKIAVLTSLLTDPNTQLRVKAVNEVVAATNGAVTLEQVVADIDSPDKALPAVQALLASKGSQLDGIMSTSWYPSVATAIAMTDSPEYRHIKTIVAENSPQVMTALDKGYISGTLFQNTYGQAYVATYVLKKVIENGCTVKPDAPFTKTDQTSKLLAAEVLVVTKDNYADYAGKPEHLPSDTDRLMGLVDNQILTCPGA